MTLRLTATILALIAAPTLASASCTYHEKQAQNCADGFVWSAEAGACVEQATS